MKTKAERKLREGRKTVFTYICIQSGLSEYMSIEDVMEYPNKYIETVDSLEESERFLMSQIYTPFWVVASNIVKAKGLIYEAIAEYFCLARFNELYNKSVDEHKSINENELTQLEFFKTKILKRRIVESLISTSESHTLFNSHVNYINDLLLKFLAIKKFSNEFFEEYKLKDIFTINVFDYWEKIYESSLSDKFFILLDDVETWVYVPSLKSLSSSNYYNLREYQLLQKLTEVREDNE